MPAVSENTSLLGPLSQGPVLPISDGRSLGHESTQIERHQADETPLPKLQIFVLCYARVVEPIAFFGIFPFIGEMIFKTGHVEKADVGFYAGLIVALPLFTIQLSCPIDD